MNKYRLPLVYLAMDFTRQDDMLRAADLIAPVQGDFGFKVNDDYVTSRTPQGAIADLAPYSKNLFVDYKLMKGGTRMKNQVLELGSIGHVNFTNIYVLAGPLLEKTIKKTQDCGVGILGITVLTHFDEDYCQLFFKRSLVETVKLMTEYAYKSSCPGVILPGNCLEAVKHIPIHKVSPGVRPSWYVGKKPNQQAQEVEPATIIKAGGNTAVVGSPVWDTPDPVESLKRILDEMGEAKARLT
ncbi:MAG TPA: orotidine 5'-phosphate decarboxylase / HUMPS family protein [Candidatus Bathyarchaeia archaeon]|nr:orotidine 5'-phosphate decarboxylase / HUMPS family protein [Candidatus Bathyarchaeia archaeon]